MKPSPKLANHRAFGEQLLALRTAIGYTQAELGKVLSLSRHAIGGWESGQTHPKVPHLKRLTEVLVEQQAFPIGSEIDAIHALWRGAHQSASLDAVWLHALLQRPQVSRLPLPTAEIPQTPHNPGKPHNLPSQTTELYGRAEEIAAVAARMREPQTRQLTLTGLGGIGKTRLGLAVAAELLSDFPDGVYFVALDQIQEATQVGMALVNTLGIRNTDNQPVPKLLVEWLQPRKLLLILDNCEHVLQAAPLVIELLRAAPHLNVLATSRVPVGIYGEQEHAVAPLPVPAVSATPNLAILGQNAAVKLFIARAQAVASHFHLNQANAAAISEICIRLEGLPLAIELAAARVRALPPAQIIARLSDRLDFSAPGRSGPIRQQTLRATLDWSYALLPPQEQQLLILLSVFVGGASLEAVTAICQLETSQPQQVVDALIALVSQSLVQAQFEGEIPRYLLLESVRQYSRERLVAQDNARAIQHAHAQYFLALAEEISARWGTVSFEQSIPQLQREYDNMRAALIWSCDHDLPFGLRFADALWQYWRSYGYITEGRAWLNQLLARSPIAGDPGIVKLRLRAMHAAAWLASDQHDYSEANRLFQASIALRQTAELATLDTDILLNAARQARTKGDYTGAVAILEHALAWHRSQGHSIAYHNRPLSAAQQTFGQVLREFGLVTREQGNFVLARSLFEESLSFHQIVNDRTCVALALIGLADVARDQGDSEEVQEYGQRALVILRELGVAWAIGFTLNSLALGAYYQGDLTQAAAHIRESERIFRDLQSNGSLSEILITVGKIERAQQHLATANTAMTEALRLALAVGPRLFVAASLEGLASIAILQDQAEQALRLLALAAVLRTQMGAPMCPADHAVGNQTSTMIRARLGDTAVAAVLTWADALPREDILSTIASYASQ